MNKKINIWICICILAISSVMARGSSFASVSLGNEDGVVALVNHIRQDPLGYAETLGYDRETLLATLPWLSSTASNLKMVVASEFLNQKAAAQNHDDPVVYDPVFLPDMDFAFTGDIGGVVSFINFMDPMVAINVIINNQFARELDALHDGKRYILSTDYDLVGASFQGGRTILEGKPRNAYFVSICFASSLLKSEVQVLNLINQMRAKPSESHEYLSLNTGFLSGGFQPLFFNDSLRSTAMAGLPSDADFSGYALSCGFTGAGVVESSVVETFPKTDSNLYALWIFSSLISSEARLYPVKNAIFNPEYNEIGPVILYVDGIEYDLVKLTLASGYTEKPDPALSKVYGLVFSDIDENKFYTPGEGVPDQVVTVYDKLTQVKICAAITNNAGQFSMSLPNNLNYIVLTGTGENWAAKDIYLTSDLFIDLIVVNKQDE